MSRYKLPLQVYAKYAAFSCSLSIFAFALASSLEVIAFAADGGDFAPGAADVAVARGLFGSRLRSGSDLSPISLLPLVAVASCQSRSCTLP